MVIRIMSIEKVKMKLLTLAWMNVKMNKRDGPFRSDFGRLGTLLQI